MPGRLAGLSAYELRHLGRHLVASGSRRQLRHLLRLDAEDGRNAWYEAKWAIDDLDGFQGDLRAAWRMADGRGGVGDQVDYALITASISGLASELPAALLATMVTYGVVSPSYAVQSVRQVPVAARQADVIGALAPHLPEEQRLQVLEVARGIEAKPVRARALASLAPFVPVRLRASVVAEALASAADLPPDEWAFDEPEAWVRNNVLADIAPLAVELDRQDPERRFMASMLRLARSFTDGEHNAERCVRILATLIPHLDGKLARATTAQAIRVTRSLKDVPFLRRRSTVPLLPFLPRGQRRLLLARWWLMTSTNLRDRVELLAGIVAAGPERERNEALAQLLRHLARKNVLKRLLSRVSPADFANLQVEAVVRVAPYVRPGSPEALALLDLVLVMADDRHRTDALAAVVHLAPADQHEDLAATVIEHPDSIRYSKEPKALARVAPLLSAHRRQQELERAFRQVTRLNDEGPRVELLAELAFCQDDQGQRQAVRHVLTAVTDDDVHDDENAAVLACLAPVLDTAELAIALGHAATMSEHGRTGEVDGKIPWRATEVVLDLAPYLPEHLLDQALDIIADVPQAHQGMGLGRLAPHLSPSQTTRALEIAFATEDLRSRATAVVDLLPHLTTEQQNTSLVRLLDLCRAPGPRERLNVLVTIAPRLPEPLRNEATELALKLAGEGRHDVGDGTVMRQVALLLPDDRQPALLELVRGLDTLVARLDALRGLAPVLPEPLVAEAIELARDWFGTPGYLAEILAALLPRVPDSQLDTAIELVASGSKREEAWWADALAALSHRLSAPQLDRAFEIARGFEGYRQAKVLSGLFPHLRRSRQAEALSLLGEGMLADVVQHVPRELMPSLLDRVGRLTKRARTLGEVAAHLPPELLPRAVKIAVATETDADRGDSLACLAPHLREKDLRTAFEAAKTIGELDARATAETALARLDSTDVVTALLDASRVESPARRPVLLRDLAPRLHGRDDLPWRQVLQTLARRGRSQLVDDLRALAPALGWQDDPALARQVFDSVARCGRWWP